MKIFEEIAFKTICAVNEAKYNPVKTAVKAASAISTIHGVKIAIHDASNLDDVIEDIVCSYQCGKENEGVEMGKLWAKLAFQDATNQKAMKKVVKDLAKVVASTTILTK